MMIDSAREAGASWFTIVLTVLWCAPSAAQESAPSAATIEEVVVTAQKRSENVQDVPLAVSAIDDQALERLGIDGPLSLSVSVPNLSMQNNSGVTYIYLRGVGNNFLGLGIDSNIAYHSNGVYVGRPRAQVASYFDVERIEVVRGPQGDLYGRNATGGSINVVSRKPTDAFEANATVAYGNYDHLRLDAGIGGPVAGDRLQARLAGYMTQRDGFGDNVGLGGDVDDQDEYGARLTILGQPTENLSIELIGDYFEADDSFGSIHQYGRGVPTVPTYAELVGFIPDDPRDVNAGVYPNRTLEVSGVQGTIDWELSESLSLRSISAYRSSEFTALDELIGTNPSQAAITQLEKAHQFSEEVQLLASTSRLDMIIGAYYFEESVEGFINIPLYFAPGAVFDQRGSADTEALAIFANAAVRVSDRWKLILGARYSEEDRDADGQFTAPFVPIPSGGSASFSDFTPKATLQFRPNDTLSFYAGASKGFKSGGFTIGIPGPALSPEELWSYEIGMKSEFFDRRVVANLAAFYYDYQDLVVTRVVGAATVNENAAKATIQGFEAEVTARPTDRLRLDFSVGLLDPTYDSYTTPDPLDVAAGPQDLSGNRLPGSSEYTARIGAQYDFPLANGASLSLSADAIFTGDMYFDPYEHRTAYQDSYELYNASLTYDSGGMWSARLWGLNLSDETIVSNQLISSDFWGFPRLTYLRDPRRYGIDFSIRF